MRVEDLSDSGMLPRQLDNDLCVAASLETAFRKVAAVGLHDHYVEREVCTDELGRKGSLYALVVS